MTNKIFLIRQKNINHFFKNSKQYFLKLLKNHPNLDKYRWIINDQSTKIVLNFCNAIIYFSNSKLSSKIKIQKTLDLGYVNILKAITLLFLSLNSNTKYNIFGYDFEEKQVNENPQNLLNIDNNYFDQIINNKNKIYSLAFYLQKKLDINISIIQCYSLLINIILLILIKQDMYISKKYFFFKINRFYKANYSENKTKEYLLVFKEIRITLQNIFKDNFNDLIFILNS